MPNGKKQCIRCGKFKTLNTRNFKKREPYLYFDAVFDRMCKICRDRYDEKTMPLENENNKEHEPRECRREDCNVVFTPRRDDQVFCKRTCGMLHRRAKNKEGKAERTKKRNSGEGIPNKFLVRGKIYGVDYR